MNQTSQPLLLPRGLIFLASIWLIGSWIIAMGVQRPLEQSSASYEPGVRLMAVCVTLGLMVGWPLLRLSQRPSAYPIRQTLLDLVVLGSMVQVVIWPLRLVTTWSVMRTAAIDATLGGWLLLAGATVAAAIGSERTGPRSLAMTACICMCLLGPALAVLGAMAGVEAMALVNLSPLLAVYSLSQDGGAPIPPEQWSLILVLGIAAVAVWVALLAYAAISARRSSTAIEV